MGIKLKYTLPNLWPVSTEMNFVWSWVYNQVQRSSMNQASDPKFTSFFAFLHVLVYIYRQYHQIEKGGAKFKGLRALLYWSHCKYTCIKKKTYIYCGLMIDMYR